LNRRVALIKKVKVEDAIGLCLAHDITGIVPGSFKGPAFRRGHIIKAEDIPGLLRLGKRIFMFLTLEKGEIHEEDAALRIAQAVAGSGFTQTQPREGRVDLVTSTSGLIKINITGLNKINKLGQIIISTIHNNTYCKEGTTVAGMRIVPLFITN